MNMMKKIVLICLLEFSISVSAQVTKTPIMGWSSWNNFHVKINEQIIQGQADAMNSSGMYDAGYRFINIDDGDLWLHKDLGKIGTGMSIKVPAHSIVVLKVTEP